MVKNLSVTKKKVFSSATALLLLTLMSSLYLTGCVQGNREVMERDMNYVKTTSEKLGIKIRTLERITIGVQKDMDNTRKGLSSIETEIKSAIAESNAELERFREEFGFIRGTLEETDFSRNQFRQDIKTLQEGLEETNTEITTIKGSAEEAGKSNILSEGELKELITMLSLRTQAIERNYLTVDKNIIDLEERLNEMGVSGGAARDDAAAEPGDLYMKGFEEASRGDYVNATETLKNFLQRFPEHDLSDDAQYWLSESYYGKGDWERSILEFNKVIKYYPSSDKAATSLLKQGLSFGKLGAKTESAVILRRVTSKYEGTPEAVEAERALNKLEAKDKKPKIKTKKKPKPSAKKSDKIKDTGEAATATEKKPGKSSGAETKTPVKKISGEKAPDELLPFPKLSPSTTGTGDGAN